MTFNEIFKSSFLENVSSISVLDALLKVLWSPASGPVLFLDPISRYFEVSGG